MKRTFEDFVSSRKAVDDISDYIDHHNNAPGYIYFDSYYIEVQNGAFYCIVTTEEITCTDLHTVEKFLWDMFVEGEQS